MYDMLTVHGFPKKIFLKYSTGFKYFKNVKIWNFAKKFIPGSWNKKKSKCCFDARTEFDFVTHFWEYLA